MPGHSRAFLFMTDSFEDNLTIILEDNQSGSVTILDKVIVLIKKLADSDINNSDLKSRLSRVKAGVLSTFPHFKVSDHYLTHLTAMINSGEGDIVLSESIKDFNHSYLLEWKDCNERIAINFTSMIDLEGRTVLVHSNSSVVVAVFKKYAKVGLNVSVLQTEARPAFEGRIQAGRIAELGFEVSIIADAALARIIDTVDLIFFGSDGVFSDAFVNKIGTHMISVMSDLNNKPVYLLADSRKIVNHPAPKIFFEEPKPPEMIWDNPSLNVTPLNYYFELTPRSLIRRIFTENSGF